MRATLVKKAEGWYNLYQNNVGIGSTHSELQGYKLSKQKCDEIFGVITPEAMMKDIESNCEKTKEGFVLGFMMASELGKDKQFTRQDMLEAIHQFANMPKPTMGDTFLSIWKKVNRKKEDIVDEILASKQPTEIEVDIEMLEHNEWYERYLQGYLGSSSIYYKIQHCQPIDGDVPRTDSQGCLILKKLDNESNTN